MDEVDDHRRAAHLVSGDVVTHPLQDVDLSDMPESQQQQPQQLQQHESINQRAATKANWVKFDDETGSEPSETSPHANNSNSNSTHSQNNHNQASGGGGGGGGGEIINPLPPPVAMKRQSTAATATTTEASALSVNAAIARPRTPTTTAAAYEHATRSPSPANKATEQRLSSAVGHVNAPDVAAPAVLDTESTHVNLNASAKSQHQHKHHQHQQHHQLQQQQQQQQGRSHNATSHKNSNNTGMTAAISSPLPSAAATTSTAPLPAAVATVSSSGGGVYAKAGTSAGAATPLAAATAAAAALHGSGVAVPVENAPAMRTIELSTGRIREGFANGDVIVTLLPANTKWPWITPAIFRPELVPEELMAQGLTLTVEDYVNAMETLVNDYRFTVYNICYKRILVCWIFFAFAVLLALLFSGLQGVALFTLGVTWLFLNAVAIFVCMWIKLRLSRGLEKCLARVNRQLMKHKILLVLDDRGRISCHKVNLCFMYFDATQCVNFLNEFLEQTEQNGGEAIKAGWEAKLDIDLNDIVIQGNNPVRLSRKQERGMQLFLRYGARWGMEALRGLVDITPLEPGRHCGQFQCPCQYIKDHLQCKPRGYPCSCIAYASDPYFQNRY